MYRFFGEQDAYSLFNQLSFYAMMVSSLFFAIWKRKHLGIFSKYIVDFFSRFKFKQITHIVEFILATIEMALFAFVLDRTSGFFNYSFGKLVGTGANYFAVVFLIPFIWSLLALILQANPVKQMDTATFMIPIQLTFFKTACFFNGCCWGIPWEYGLYNHHYHHPGKQVPVQAIEAFFAVAIFVFLLFYRKKAKTGTIYPMFMILYGGTRFFSEFFTAAYPDIIGPFNMYQILCTISVVVGVVLFFIVRKYSEKISDFFDKPQRIIDNRIRKAKEIKEERIAEEKAKTEAEMQERLEKAKLARAKAKARKK